MVIYADDLFFVNFSMDFLSLYITARALHTPVKTGRLCLAASVGAIFATVRAMGTGNRVLWTAAFLACGIFMCAVSFSGKIGYEALVFGGVNCGLGGMMTLLYRLLYQMSCHGIGENWAELYGGIGQGGTASPVLLAVSAGISGAVSLIYGCLRGGHGKKDVSVTVESGGIKMSFCLLVDSGNLLREPFGGLPVIIVRKDKLHKWLPDVEKMFFSGNDTESAAGTSFAGKKAESEVHTFFTDAAKRLRVIPASSVTGNHVLYGFLPDKTVIGDREVKAVIAAAEGEFNGYDGIVPEILCEG